MRLDLPGVVNPGDMATDLSPADDTMVQDAVARRFVAALRSVEDDGDVDPMRVLFDDDADLHRLGGAGPHTGPDGATRFWTEYRDAFGEITSTFTRALETPERVVLEWTAEGVRLDGHRFGYDGVSVLDLAADGDRLSGFRTYYDTAALLTAPAADTSPDQGSTGSASAGV